MRTLLPPVSRLLMLTALLLGGVAAGHAQSPYQSSEDFARYAMKLRENALLKIEPEVFVPTTSRPSFFGFGGNYPWKTNIVTTIFWVGELPTARNPVPNTTSAWDPSWEQSFGGFDNPDPGARRNYIPVGFIPRQNPFYCALPYNDVTHHTTKPEAPMVIPWFKQAYRGYGESVCRNHWIAIRNREGRTCYAQWSDCGPFSTDNWQYVFGNEVPRPNINHGAGLDVSPAVRDFLGLSSMDVTSWRFVDFKEVPPGPWASYGDNNDFVMYNRRNTERVASRIGSNSGSDTSPMVITR